MRLMRVSSCRFSENFEVKVVRGINRFKLVLLVGFIGLDQFYSEAIMILYLHGEL